MQIKKYLRVNYKLSKRRLQRNPHVPFLAMGFLVVGSLLSVAVYNYLIFDNQKTISTFTQWQHYQKKLNPYKKTGRGLASAQCSFDDVSIDQIKAEINFLEARYQTGTENEGAVYGLPLSKLSSIGGQMLADNKKMIGNQDMKNNYDFSGCEDVPCVLNKIYRDPTGISGYASYYWYLKTGSVISTSNFIPNQKAHNPGSYGGSQHQFEDYLFSREELLNFYFLAKSLPEKLTFLPLFKSIHKIPGNKMIEGVKSVCSQALPNGHILLSQNCLKDGRNKFFINVTREIAKYVDRQEGLKRGIANISHSKQWLEYTGWLKESVYNPSNNKISYKWTTRSEDFVDKRASFSPTEQFASLVAHYRFAPKNFINQTSVEISDWIRNNIFNGQYYDPSGLYTQYINKSVHEWSVQEVAIWKKCISKELEQSKDITKTQRQLASSLDHPLYQCVEKNIPGFIQYAVKKIEKEQYQGCKFFGDQAHQHQAKRYYSNINKFVMEKVLQRKIEIRRHGVEVLTGQDIKERYIKTVDPKAVYIDCYGRRDHQYCYESKMQAKFNQILNLYPAVSDYYQQTLKEDVLALYPFLEIQKETNETVKHFLAPYTTELRFAANKMWDECKILGSDEKANLKLPLKFSGGRHYVNPVLINCLNDSIEEEIYNFAQLKAFHQFGNERLEFKLKFREQQYALSFLEGKLLQTLRNILDDDFHAEKVRFDQHFKEAKIQAITAFSDDHDTFFTNVFSFEQVRDRCLKKVPAYYPKNYYYHPKEQLDIEYGKPICNSFVNFSDVRKKLVGELNHQWKLNQELAAKYLVSEFQGEVDSCFSEYPRSEGRDPASLRENQKNERRRSDCIEDNFRYALNDAIDRWRDHKHYQYFYAKENALESHLRGLERKFIRQAKDSGKLSL